MHPDGQALFRALPGPTLTLTEPHAHPQGEGQARQRPGASSYPWAMMQGMTSPVGPEAQDRYRCPHRGVPGGQRCQLLIEHATPAHIASIAGTFRAWVDGAETTLPRGPFPWFVSFPRDES